MVKTPSRKLPANLKPIIAELSRSSGVPESEVGAVLLALGADNLPRLTGKTAGKVSLATLQKSVQTALVAAVL